MKIMALSKEFFINRWNVFDLVIVLASLLDLGLEIGSGLSVLRGMRLVSKLVSIIFHYAQHNVLSMHINFPIPVQSFASNPFLSNLYPKCCFYCNSCGC